MSRKGNSSPSTASGKQSAAKKMKEDSEFDEILKAEKSKQKKEGATSASTSTTSTRREKGGKAPAVLAVTEQGRGTTSRKVVIPKNRRPVSLYQSVTTAQQRKVNTKCVPSQRRFYPGGPRWLDMDLDVLAVALAQESSESPSTKAIAQGRQIVQFQRSLDRCHRLLPGAYAALDKFKTQLTMADHQAVYHGCGMVLTTDLSPETLVSLEQIELKEVAFEVQVGSHQPTAKAKLPTCEYCGEQVADSEDPPECVCGEVYCSDLCHAADWINHEKTCLAIEAAQKGSLGITDGYWALVLKGYFPCKAEPDFATQWLEKATEEQEKNPGQNPATLETEFYNSTEKRMLSADLSAVQFQLGRGEADVQAASLLDFQNVAMLHICRMSTPLAQKDSWVRLSWKLNMCEQFHKMVAAKVPGIQIPSRAELEAKFLPLIKRKQSEGKAKE